FRRQLSKARLVNLYGCTEVAADVTFYEATLDHEKSSGVLIGRPIHNTRVYILDSARQPVPIGVPGEIYIGGDGLARGYLNQDELTTAKFIDHAFYGEPSQR